MDRRCIMLLAVISGVFLSVAPAFSGGGIPTKVLVRVVSKDAKVIGSGVGGAAVRIVNTRTGETLAQGVQEGGTGDTDRIMIQPRGRGKTVYGTPGAAFFLAEIGLEQPTQVEIRVEAPLAFPQALQRGSKTITLIPGKDTGGEGVIIELDGLIVNILNPLDGGVLRKGEEVRVRADVKML
jgi:hypothetical protein